MNFFFLDDPQNADGGADPNSNPDDPNNAQAQQKKANDSDEEEEVKVPPKNFYELDRLAYVVRAIETECQVVPIGAYKLTPNHELRLNEAFVGLNLAEAADIGNYQHFRNPISEDKKAFICKINKKMKFLNFFEKIKNF